MTFRFAQSVCLASFVLALAVAPADVAVAAGPEVTTGQVAAVTVYQGQALVTRLVELAAGDELREVVITELPQHVIPSSIYAEPVGGAEVRSVRYRLRPVEADVREEVRRLDAMIQEIDDQLQTVDRQLQLVTDRQLYLDRLEAFTASKSKQELNRGVLNATTLQDLTRFIFAQEQEIADNGLELGRQQRELQQQRQLRQRERDQVAGGSARAVHEAVVFVKLPAGQASRLRLRYLVGQANWTPSYNLRARSDRGEVVVEYNASVHQMSGEDWSNVEMTLSTATLSLVSKAPVLEPLAIKLARPSASDEQRQQAEKLNAPALQQQYLSLNRQLEELGKARGQGAAEPNGPASELDPATAGQLAEGGYGGYGMGGYGGGDRGGRAADRRGDVFGPPADQLARAVARTDLRLNGIANELQLLDLRHRQSWARLKETTANPVEQQVSVSYRLDGRTSLPSRTDRQLVQIASLPMTSQFYRVALPLLTRHVFEEAQLVNGSKLVLLAGPVSTFVAGEFVGRGEIPTVAVGESFTVGLGIDSSLRTGRELVDKQERIQGGNRLVVFTYALTVENFANEAASVRVLDRLPMSEERDIKLTLVDAGIDISDDATYQMQDRKDGILRWDVSVPGGASGPEQFSLKYTLQLEYDKQLTIATRMGKS